MPSPEYSDYGRKKKIQGTVVLSIIVTPEGTARNIQVTKSLEPSLDKKAIECVSEWKFKPGTRDGAPVAMRITVETNFRLY